MNLKQSVRKNAEEEGTLRDDSSFQLMMKRERSSKSLIRAVTKDIKGDFSFYGHHAGGKKRGGVPPRSKISE